MKKKMTMLGVFVLGGLVGAIIMSPHDYSAQEAHEKSHMHHGSHSEHGHMHAMMDVSDWNKIPAVALSVVPDSMSGFNLYIETENFTFAPENVGEGYVEGEGHAHVYVDGEKVSRLYGSWYYLSGLEKGKHEVEVRLSSNDHKELTLGGISVMAKTVVEVD